MELLPLSLCRRLCAIAVVALLGVLFRLYNSTWRSSERLRKLLAAQGVAGPTPSLLYGNVPEMQKITSRAALDVLDADRRSTGSSSGEFVAHDYTSTLFPYFEQWRKEYGPVYTYSTGDRQHLYVNQPELMKELNQCFTLLGKPSYLTKRLAPILGNGILRSNGHSWSQQRKIVAPEFFMDKVKGMVGLMGESAQQLLRSWDERIEAAAAGGGEAMADIKVDEYLREFSADVISRACFGSSYSKGKEIFLKLRSLQKTVSKQGFLFNNNFFGFLPMKKSREVSNLEREVESLIWKLIEEREHECAEKDLMQMIMEGAVYDDQGLDKDLLRRRFIVDNCKNIYFAGHEATSVAASWCLMLLALHPEWQKCVREEVGRVCASGSILDPESLGQLKTVTMVIQEALRLYPPAAFVSREALEDTKIGNITVPKNVCIWTLIPTLHRDPGIWGPDVNKFKPERFAEGISNACKVPQAYVPFGLGPRLCLGRNFAMVELKIVISLIVSRYSLALSPKYRHSPVFRMIVEPEHGVHLQIQKL